MIKNNDHLLGLVTPRLALAFTQLTATRPFGRHVVCWGAVTLDLRAHPAKTTTNIDI
jgi:hypothetical protein